MAQGSRVIGFRTRLRLKVPGSYRLIGLQGFRTLQFQVPFWVGVRNVWLRILQAPRIVPWKG